MSLKMSKKRQYTKQAIDNALKFIENNEGSIRQAAKHFGVPRSSLQFKIRNPNTKFKSGPDPVLTDAEEKELCAFIIHLAKRGFPRKKEDIQICVQDFLKENPRPNPFRDGKPGDVWFKAFLKRHPNISIRTSEGVTNASACVSEQDIRKWFQEIGQYFAEEDLAEVIQDPTRVFNADETGFNICPKTGKVLAEKGCKNVYEIEKGSAKENITVLFTFSASGLVCNPLVIYPYKRIPDRVTLSVPSGWSIGRSDTGWMTASVFYDYIANCFYQQLLDDGIPFPVILFVDGHKTHLTIEVAELCRKLKIHLIALYPNATRILQPADVAAFRPIKVGWKKALREWYSANNYQTSLTKETFAPLLKTVVDSCAKKETLINGFRISGLYPFDADNVDYSKCIALVKQPEVALRPEANVEGNLCVLTYLDFCDVVGKAIILKCQSATALTLLESDDNFKAIYKLWQKFNGSNVIEPPDLHQETAVNIMECQLLAEINCDLPLIEDIKVPHIVLDECTGELVPNSEKNGINEDKKEEEETKENEEFNMVQISTHSREILYPDHAYQGPCMIRNDEFTTGKILNDRDNNGNKGENNEEEKENKETSELQNPTNPININNMHPGQSKQIDPSKNITIISNIPLSEYLIKKKLPDSPKRQGKRQTDKMPFALTSNACVDKIKAKQLKKQEEEAAKEERKKLREEKKMQKETVPKKKPKKSVNEKSNTKKTKTAMKQEITGKRAENSSVTNKPKIIICCDACLSPIMRRVIECSQCKKQFHLNCIPSSHRIHIPEDDDDAFLCHICYRESNSDSSDDNDDVFLHSILEEAQKQGF